MDTKISQQLIEHEMCDKTVFVYCTKWNASMGAKIISVYENDMFVTPVTGGIYGVNVKKAEKYNKSQIESISVKKSIWTGSSICITLKDGTQFKYKLIDSSWLEAAQQLVDWLK